MVCIVLEERSPRFGPFLGPTEVSVAGISPFANDVCHLVQLSCRHHHALPQYLPYSH